MKVKLILSAIAALLIVPGLSQAQEVLSLYPAGQVPFAKPGGEIPRLTVFNPASVHAGKKAVIVCSGGSYVGRANSVEGIPACKKLAEAGITAFLLDYRVPLDATMDNKEWVPLTDAQRALQYVRENAGRYKIDPHQIGMMGFSAGGHLVSTAGTHFNLTKLFNPKGTNLRPDFMVLIYPVISFADSLTHEESRKRLIGPDLTPQNITWFSNDLQVTDNTPPTYITHGMDDTGVKVANSLYFAAALKQHHVPVELFIYAKGAHGYGIFNKDAQTQWIDDCINWINRDHWKQH